MSTAVARPFEGRKSQFSEAEWRARVDLAACYRLADRNRMSMVIWNHITARVPGYEDRMLINRFGLRYDEITASNLLTIDLDGNIIDGGEDDLNTTGYVIHSAVHRVRHDAVCVMHCHSRGGTAVSALKEGLLPLCQEAMLSYGDLSYHDYEGLALDLDERERLAADLGQTYQMILRNHGLLTVGRTVAEAYWRMVTLEQACQLQMDVLASGRELVMPPREVCEATHRQMVEGRVPGGEEWVALLRQLDRDCPDYAS